MYDFDEIIDRRHTNAMNTDGFRDYIFHADENMVFPYRTRSSSACGSRMMEFRHAGRRHRRHPPRGWTSASSAIPASPRKGYYDAFAAWCRRYGWEFPQGRARHVQRAVIPALFEPWSTSAPRMKGCCSSPRPYAYFKHAADHSGREYVCLTS